jgi:AP2 domain
MRIVAASFAATALKCDQPGLWGCFVGAACVGVNVAESRRLNVNNSSGYRGVCHERRCPRRPWRATVMYRRRTVDVGYYGTPEQAAHAALKAD